MFLISASLAQALLFRTWNEPVSKRFQALLVVLVVGLAFEYLRQYGTFQQRVALIMGGRLQALFGTPQSCGACIDVSQASP
jgi:hypothetical protein